MATDRQPARAKKVGAALVALWVAYEGIRLAAYVPTAGDVPTIGAGSTQYEDGTRVKLSDAPITRVRALELATNLLEQQYAPCVRDSLGDARVSETEFNLAVDFAGNYGCRTWRNSSIARDTHAGNYLAACSDYRKYRFQAGRDCALPVNWGPRGCKGVFSRSQARYKSCMEAQ